MLIDWFTVGAQVLNFVVLVWLMKRFLYQPVLDAIAAREKRIADQIADATAKQAQAETERKIFEDKNTAFDQQRSDLLTEAQAQANTEGLRLTDAAQTTAAALAARQRKALATQAENLQQLIASRAAHEVFAIARKTLGDLANVDLEGRMVEVFMRRLTELSVPAKDQLVTALKQSHAPARLQSCFALPADQQAAIQQAVNLAFGTNVALQFDIADDAVCGIELSTGGQSLAWNINEYLNNLEQEVAALLVPSTKLAAA